MLLSCSRNTDKEQYNMLETVKSLQWNGCTMLNQISLNDSNQEIPTYVISNNGQGPLNNWTFEQWGAYLCAIIFRGGSGSCWSRFRWGWDVHGESNCHFNILLIACRTSTITIKKNPLRKEKEKLSGVTLMNYSHF